MIVIAWIVFIRLEQIESHKKVCDNKYFCYIVILSEDTNILEFNQYQKYDNALFFINAEPECLIGKIDGFKYNPEKLSTTKAGEHILSGLSMSTIS